ncbi:MAG TPA: beta-galactosidase [Actinomycetales bacterium]|nr:beta-galactosidase [Actinomycetales bacterium]
MRDWPTHRIALGGDYNPEQWPRDVWREDVDLMREAGVTFATVGVFAWSLLEPEPGRFELDWLDEVLGLLDEGGIAVDLATATASPPPWLPHLHPETLPVTRDGLTMWPGGRQAWCPSSPVFREHAVRLTEELATRYHDHPALAMWHVSNEYGCHNAPCYCDVSAAAFRDWLRDRYGDVEALNEAWGTAFWSQRYATFDHVLPPRLAPTTSNPTQELDYRRFTSDALLDQYAAEREVLHRLSPGVPVTTNFMTLNHFRHLDYHRWAPLLDVVSTDHYLVATEPDAEAELAFSGDLTRGLAGGRPWLLMEHSSSAVNWQPVNVAKAPGQMLRNSVAHVAHGADGLGFFQWRQSVVGAEKFHSALVPHAGTGTDLWRDVVGLGDVCDRLGEVVGSRVEASVALLWDYEAGWACDLPSHPSSLLRYGDDAHAVHAALLHRGIACDVVHPESDLSGYRVVVVPTLYLMRRESAAAVAAASSAGAQVLVTFFSGIVDEDDHVRLGGYPGALRELLGIRVDELRPLQPGEVVELDDGTRGSLWSERVTLPAAGDGKPADVLVRYDGGVLDGLPALTRRQVGDGAAWYVSTRLDPAGLDRLLEQVLDAAGVAAPVEAPRGVEQVRRRGDDGSYLFLISHRDDQVQLAVRGHDLVADLPVDGRLTLAPGAVAVVREAVDSPAEAVG